MYYGFASISLFNIMGCLMVPMGFINLFKSKTVKQKSAILRRSSFHAVGVAQNIVHLTMSERFQVRAKIVSKLLAKKKQAQKNIEKRKQMEKKTE